MQVRAKAKGYGGKNHHALREPGDVFEVEDGVKGSWFEPIEQPRKPDGGKPHNGKQTGDTLVG